MLLQEIFERTLLESGQFQLPPDKLELNVDRFKTLVQIVLGLYNRYNPLNVALYKNIAYLRQYTFTEENTPGPLRSKDGLTLVNGGPPDWILDLIPVRISGVYPYFLREYDRPKSNVEVKTDFPWEYRNPTLTVPIVGEFDISAVYFHRLTEKILNDSTVTYEISSINDLDDNFFKLCAAKFLKGIGRSRRAFTMNDLPILSDGAELVSEGQTLEDKTSEDMAADSKFYLAWR
jgi:hypothetical protein